MPLEQQLIRRLKMLGIILFVFSAVALIYKQLPKFEEEIVMEEEEPAPPLNPFFVSTVFGVVGSSCLLISWKKKKNLFSPSPEKDDPQ